MTWSASLPISYMGRYAINGSQKLNTANPSSVDIVLIGGGIMSATMATLLQRLRPDWSIVMYERAEAVATESSGDWNNSGTGHSGLCELNYTPQQEDGSIATSKAITVNDQFRESLSYWAHLVETGAVSDPDSFISPVPHASYVTGADDVTFLRSRYNELRQLPAFNTMEFSEDRDQMAEWAPLMFADRKSDAPVAMTHSDNGTDVNFGAITRHMVKNATDTGMQLLEGHEVVDLERTAVGWRSTVRNRGNGMKHTVDSRFVFVGAGGAAIHLLQKAGIPEAKGYGGFPVSGKFLRCMNPEIVAQHEAKVYGKPQLNAPPMSMPHLDTRWVNGEQVLLFGPFAGFEPRFLQKGSQLDLFRSIKLDNIKTYLTVALDEFGLTSYLVRQLLLKHTQRMDVLRDFMPSALDANWELHDAGMRVQTLKRGKNGRGKLEFGTEVVSASDGTIAGLLGASPGASASVSIVLQILESCFPDEFAKGMRAEFGEIFPLRSVDPQAADDALPELDTHIARVLGLKPDRQPVTTG